MHHLPLWPILSLYLPPSKPPWVSDSVDLESSFPRRWFKITIACISDFRPLKYMWDEVMWSVRSAIQTSLLLSPFVHVQACVHMCVCVTICFGFVLCFITITFNVLLLTCIFVLLEVFLLFKKKSTQMWNAEYKGYTELKKLKQK